MEKHFTLLIINLKIFKKHNNYKISSVYEEVYNCRHCLFLKMLLKLQERNRYE